MKVDLDKLFSIKGYAEKTGVSRTQIDKWLKKRNDRDYFKNPVTGKKFKYIEHNYLKLIKEL